MIFVDTNVFMYAVGRPHPLQEQAREFFARSIENRRPALHVIGGSAGVHACIFPGRETAST